MLKIRLKAVLFDMDGVITHTMPYHYRSWCKIFHKENLKFNKHDVYSREGQKGINSIKEIFLENGKTINNQMAQEILESKERLFQAIVKPKFIIGSRRFVKRLSLQEFRLGIVTGTSRVETNKILPQYLRDLFFVIITGNEVRNGKPHPESYLRALSELRLDPQEVLVIENAPLGIKAAKAAKIRTLALATSLPAKYLKEADMIFNSFRELQEKVEFIHTND